MTITIEYSPAEMEVITAQAKAGNTSVEEFIRTSSSKAARNAEYLAKIDRAYKNKADGKSTMFTGDEWESFVHEQELR